MFHCSVACPRVAFPHTRRRDNVSLNGNVYKLVLFVQNFAACISCGHTWLKGICPSSGSLKWSTMPCWPRLASITTVGTTSSWARPVESTSGCAHWLSSTPVSVQSDCMSCLPRLFCWCIVCRQSFSSEQFDTVHSNIIVFKDHMNVRRMVNTTLSNCSTFTWHEYVWFNRFSRMCRCVCLIPLRTNFPVVDFCTSWIYGGLTSTRDSLAKHPLVHLPELAGRSALVSYFLPH